MSTPDGDLGRQLGTLLSRWRAAVGDVLAAVPSGPRGFHVLGAVVHGSPPTQAALAADLGIDRTVMTYLVDRLVDCGLVERQPDPTDRRVRRIVPTAAGRATHADLATRIATAEDHVLAALDPGQRATLRTLLSRASGAPAHGEDVCAVVSVG
ncbi:MarR family winged helix-turn-helix transcriptional regulator [Cellulomonas shaoxiangyii]|uniref:MarR family transcriptional regulator n=1 Tax=Cellulomonas shaoxiangyii TaxID=2566013 RepID=A0A4P7SII1_9CELL|nr:MarR family winged helix-turn-helix transcriptional regulator [Cellulomonas shaoxiangyii]QCB92474.1 MarR family transcriptional regulator [Cellulomonas shaoxiangyii]TGY84974.1 MarR family transcriptional regulator [Cellulomonas shaoxiangyii]